MKKIQFIELVGIVALACLVGCSKYKTFQEEAAALNAEYSTSVQDIFAKNKMERAPALAQAQEDYDTAFAAVAKRWKVEAATSPLHLNFSEMFCKQMITEPYQKVVGEIVAQNSAAFQKAMSARDSNKVLEISRTVGEALGTQTALYGNKAKANNCAFTGGVDGQEIVAMLME